MGNLGNPVSIYFNLINLKLTIIKTLHDESHQIAGILLVVEEMVA